MKEDLLQRLVRKVPIFGRRLDDHMVEVVSGASVAFALKMGGAVLTFCFNLLLARTLGAEGVGIYFLAMTVTIIATVFGRMGLDNALLRFTAANVAVNNWSAVKGLYLKGMSSAIVASTLSAVVMFLTAPLLAEVVFRKSELVVPMRWMALAVVPMTLLILHAEMLKGLKRIRDSLLIFGVGVPAISLIGIYILAGVYGVNGAVWAYIIAVVLVALFGALLWRLATPKLRDIKGHFNRGELFKSSRPLFWIDLLTMTINWTAIFSLGIWGTKEEVGVFGIAFRIAMLMSFILFAVNSIVAPKFAEMYKRGDIEALASTARSAAKMMIIMASPLLLIFLFLPEWVMGIFGEEFKGGAILLIVLAVGQFVNIAAGPVAYMLMMSGNEHVLRINVLFIAGVSIVLNVILVPSFGSLGAAIATTICLASMNLISVYFVWRRLNICVIPFLGRI